MTGVLIYLFNLDFYSHQMRKCQENGEENLTHFFSDLCVYWCVKVRKRERERERVLCLVSPMVKRGLGCRIPVAREECAEVRLQ